MGKQRYKQFIELIIISGIFAVFFDQTLCAYVHYVSPSSGGVGGEIRLTIYGEGFSQDQFSQNNDPDRGNLVYLVSESGSRVSCDVLPQVTTKNQIVCYTPAKMSEEDYYIRVSVNGIAVEDDNLCNGDNCIYRPKSSYTPSITSMTPQSGIPGDFVTLSGKIFTDRYGPKIRTSGRSWQLLRVYVGPKDCDLKNGDDFFGLSLRKGWSDGSILCKTKGKSVGYYNASFIIEAPYGRALPESDVYRVSSTDKIYMYQLYTDITSISPAKGSTEGGLTLTIYGQYFDDKPPYVAPKAFVGDTQCTITKLVVDEYIECTVAAAPTNEVSTFRGNRGVILESWNFTSISMSNIDDILSMTDSDPGYKIELLDETCFYATKDIISPFVSRMTTYFIPPHDGEYSFILKAEEEAKLFVDGVEVLYSYGYPGSNRMNLSASHRYLLKIVHYENSDYWNAYVELGAKFYDTNFTNVWTGKAEQEVQTISITSDVVYDVQELTFSGSSNNSYVKEIQTVEITSAGYFRLGLYGTYTEPLSRADDETVVGTAIDSLPVFSSDESVTVVRNSFYRGDVSLTFTFESRRGDFPPIEVVAVVDNPVPNVTITEETKGVPDSNTVALKLEGAVSMPFSLVALDAGILETTMDGLFSAQCPDFLTGSVQAHLYESFESNTGAFWGTITKETDPFCDRYTLKNPTRLYYVRSYRAGVPLSQYNQLCFAYKGLIRDYIWLRYSYEEYNDDQTKSTRSTSKRYDFDFKADSDTESKTWYYTCFDMMSKVSDTHPEATNFRLKEVEIARSIWEKDVFVDALFIGSLATTTDFEEINLRRRPAAMSKRVTIDTVTVTATSDSTDAYVVTLRPFECGNQFPLFELANSQVLNGDVSYPSNDAVYMLSEGHVSLSVKRTAQASPPVTGDIDITFDGNTKNDLNVSVTSTVFGKELESTVGIGDLLVNKYGNCANFRWEVTFWSLSGNLPEMLVGYDGLKGINAKGSIYTTTDGGLWYTPLTGDMLSTVHDEAQVRLYINDVPTKCSGDCSFEWDSIVTPTVTSVTPTRGSFALETTIVISGSGFDSEPTNNTVIIGGINCDVISCTANTVACSVQVGPVGPHKVEVIVAGKGLAKHLGIDVTFEYAADIISIDPVTGSQGGGITLTVYGYGFKSSAMVTVGSGTCDVINVTLKIISCVVPASESSEKVSVTVFQDSSTYSFFGFVYNESLTPLVSSIWPRTIGVAGDTITVIGSNFGATGTVSVGAISGNVVSYSDTEVLFEVSRLSAGVQDIRLGGTDGYALLGKNRPSINVELTVTSVCPLSGSLQGGTRLTLTGLGFGNVSSKVEVYVGNVSCDIETVTYTQIVCMITNARKIHRISNLGSHRAYGIYYAFDKPQITIERGDIVYWSWETPDFINGINHAIIEVDSLSATKAKRGGFTSGRPSRNGTFQYQFTQLGTFYVWSGYVDVYGIKNYAGQIEVVEKNSRLGEISVKVHGIESLYTVGGNKESSGLPCQPVRPVKSECMDAFPSGGDTSKFNFAFWSCATPVVDAVDQRRGTVKTVITVSGDGFAPNDWQNEIRFSDYICAVLSSTETAVTCTMDRMSTPELTIYHPISVRVENYGNAVVNIMLPLNRSFGLLPNVEEIIPTTGSLAGGARLTITGFGFENSLSVLVGIYTCRILKSSYTDVICETPPSASPAEVNVEVYITVNGVPRKAVCETENQECIYKYSLSNTPTMSAVYPSSMSKATTFTIRGSNFGNDTSTFDIQIGTVNATMISSNETHLVASIQNVPAGPNKVVVKHAKHGKAYGDVSFMGTPIISSVLPSSGSIYGETEVTIIGNGFVEGHTIVDIGGSFCTIISISLSQVICFTTAHTAGSVRIDITSNSVSYPSASFTYASSFTPTVVSISPTSGFPGDVLTIFGSNLAGSSVVVNLDKVPCDIKSGSRSQIQCTIGAHATGSVPVSVHVNNLGASNADLRFKYDLQLSSINPTKGSIAGGQTVTLSGHGFSDTMTANICGVTCVLQYATPTDFECKTRAVFGKGGETSLSKVPQTCNVTVSINGLFSELLSAYTYDAALTPSVTMVTPRRGGTGGGTPITVVGSGFGSNKTDVSVVIDGVACEVTTVSDTELKCETSPHHGSVNAKVEVQVCGNGIAEESSNGASDFFYIDVWASKYTWGGSSPPIEGNFVVIPAGQTLLLDTDTPVLSFLLIQGGQLIFDEQDIELKAKIIMITDGGLLQVGTEDKPFKHKAIITLHGHLRSRELPVYGSKVLAVRSGSLELHGEEVPLTWTKLSATAEAGDSSIHLSDSVNWKVDDKIVIATTGNHHTQSENEKKTIIGLSEDNKTLILDSALDAKHLGVEETFDGKVVEFRAEVGLLTHNIVVRGAKDSQWTEYVEACPDGFNTGEFAVQTCFLGRFGDEIGSSQFGAIIIVSSLEKGNQTAEARLSYIEVTYAGQAFRLGRYPIYFHFNADMTTSYIRGLSIHETFNQAVNIHDSHNLLVEKTVIYNTMGGGVVLEAGSETGNVFQYNLAVLVRESSSLQNDDITPASFMVTNPNNTIQHNAAAGGSHFGFWYRLHNHPDGPSYTPDVCPFRVPLGVFQNNSAHSFGWFGLWIFENYFPSHGCWSSSVVTPAIFRGLTAWNNDKGVEVANSGVLQFHDFVLVQNRLAGYEGKNVYSVPLCTDDRPMVINSLIVGTTTVAPSYIQGCTKGGIVLPYGAGFRIKNVQFFNFGDKACTAFKVTRVNRLCTLYCGGYNYEVEGVSFTNSSKKVFYEWDWEAILIDKDGSLTGKQEKEWKVLPTSGTLPKDCEAAPDFSVGVPASVCPPQYNFHRFAFNRLNPSSLKGKSFIMRNRFGHSIVPFAGERVTHREGWMCALVGRETYKFEFENGMHIQNISFTGTFYEFESSDFVIIRLSVKEFPDKFSISGGSTDVTLGSLDSSTAANGDWAWHNNNNEIQFIVRGEENTYGDTRNCSADIYISLSTYKCYYKECVPPRDPDTVLPLSRRPPVFQYWHDVTIWNVSSDGYIVNTGGSYGVPQNYDDVRIIFDSWVFMNASINILGNLVLNGVLECTNHPEANYELNAYNIIIMGGRLIIGWPEDPFPGHASIILRGNHSSPYYTPKGSGPKIGSKCVGVFGGLDLFGKDVGVTWTKLAVPALNGESQIVLADIVSWVAGDEIVIGPSRFDPWETETFMIILVSGDGMTLTLNESLKYDHLVYRESFPNGQSVNLGAPVGLLTRNVKVIGEHYNNLYSEGYGARVLVGLYTRPGQTYTGYARLSNVEFVHTGQEGFTEPYDARFSLAFIAAGSVSNIKPSVVKKCSFHKSFNSAIGVFGTNGLHITDTVVHHTVGSAIVTTSSETKIINNMVAVVEWTGTYQGRFEAKNFRWEAGIEAMKAKRLVLQDNLVTASERLAFHAPPLKCDDTSGYYRNNMAFSNLIAYGVFPDDDIATKDCVQISSLTAWKNHDFGIYYQNEPGLVIAGNVLVDNRQGIWTGVLGPDPLRHEIGKKKVAILNNLLVGTSPTYDCVNDISPTNDNMVLSALARPSMAPTGGKIGVVFPNFMAAKNDAPKNTFTGISAYNSIAGLMKLTNVTFAHYGSSACNDGDYAIGSNGNNDDGQHPIEAELITLYDVEHNHKVVYHRPNMTKINPADCIDMDCDAFKKVLLKDLDGTFLGHVGAVIPQAEYGWGPNSHRGLGDYRIPREMVTDINGTRIPYADIAPNKGVIRNSNCTFHPSWQAYECGEDLNYEMLIIESMDPDTETRRISPVAILGDGYVDLINGPQDHSRCHGHACRKRISTFMALVATEKEYLMHFTGTTPFHMRYTLLNTDTEAIKLTVWYSRSNRLDVYVDGNYLMATNAKINDRGFYVLDMPKADEYTPKLENATGTNKVDHIRGEHTIIIKGSTPVEVITNEVIIVSFGLPAMTVDDFYGANIVENVAAFLNIPLNKVKVVNAVSEKRKSGRQKRNIDGISVELEIGDEPASQRNDTVEETTDTVSGINGTASGINGTASGINDTVSEFKGASAGINDTLSGTTDTEPDINETLAGINDTMSQEHDNVSESLDYHALLYIASQLVDECQLGDLTVLNLTGSCEGVEVPAKSADDELIIYNTQRPDKLVFTVDAVPSYETVPLLIQPKIQAIDSMSVAVSNLGTIEYPWKMTASIRTGFGHPDAVLHGNLHIDASNGWFNYTDLEISHSEAGYILDFNVTYPPRARNFTLSTSQFDVTERPLQGYVRNKTDGDILSNATFFVELDLRDLKTGEIIDNIGWRNHTWHVETAMLGNPKYGDLGGVLSTTFDPITGRAIFSNLRITGFCFFYIQFRIYSEPTEYNFTLNEKMYIMNPLHVGLVSEAKSKIQVKFNVDYDNVLPTKDILNKFEQMILCEFANSWPDVKMTSGVINKGSVIVTFDIEGSQMDVDSLLYSLCESISNSTTYTFDGYNLTLDKYMIVNNQTFFGVECAVTTSSDEGLPASMIAIIVAVPLIFAAVVTIVVWKCYILRKMKTPVLDLRPKGPQYLDRDNKQVEEQLFSEDTVPNIKFRPPISTLLGNESGSEKRPLSGLSVSALSLETRSPEPKDQGLPEPTFLYSKECLADSSYQIKLPGTTLAPHPHEVSYVDLTC